MYTAFFGLQRDPFTISPDPRFLYLSERHREALAHLLFGAHGAGGVVLLTGDIGAGKTTICRRFLEEAPQDALLAYIFNPRLSVAELLRSIGDEFGVALPPPDAAHDATVKSLVDPLNHFLLHAHATGRNPVLIIDEAQNLASDVLEQLRLLTNLETNERKLLQIVLIGQPELRTLLASPGLEQLAQRVVARFHLGPLDDVDSAAYVAHRLQTAGLTGPVPFNRRALRLIYRLSGGVPRRINLLCGRALLGAFSQGRREVGPAIVRRAAAEVFGDTAPQRSSWRVPLALAGGLLAGAAMTAAALGWWSGHTARPGSEHASMAPLPSEPQAPRTTPLPPPAIPASPVSEALPKAGQLVAREDEGWRALAALWSLDTGNQPPCDAAEAAQMQCYRIDRITWHGVRQMDRPALLRLHLPDGAGFVLLEGLDATHVLLRAGEQRWRLPVDTVSAHWRGEYLALWRTPPGQQGRLTVGQSGPAARWLAEQLQRLQDQGELDASATTLTQQIRAFQRSRGLEVVGRAGPSTYMLLNRAVGVTEPRLGATLP